MPRSAPLIKRFWDKVDVGGPTDCWEWTASCGTAGYGQIKVAGRTLGAHRFAYELTNGEIPEGLHVCHTCDYRKCVNPNHLFLGTRADNMADCARKNRMPARDGEKNYSAKLTEAEVVQIRAAYPDQTQPELAQQYGVSQSTISRIVHQKRWAGGKHKCLLV